MSHCSHASYNIFHNFDGYYICFIETITSINRKESSFKPWERFRLSFHLFKDTQKNIAQLWKGWKNAFGFGSWNKLSTLFWAHLRQASAFNRYHLTAVSLKIMFFLLNQTHISVSTSQFDDSSTKVTNMIRWLVSFCSFLFVCSTTVC